MKEIDSKYLTEVSGGAWRQEGCIPPYIDPLGRDPETGEPRPAPDAPVVWNQ